MAFEKEIYKLLDARRYEWDKPKLTKDKRLVMSGRYKGEQLEATGTFTHHVYEQKDWIKTFDKAGYPGAKRGEVLARGFKYPASVVRGWANSPAHYKVISDKGYKNYGIYAYLSKDGKIYVVGHFGN